MAVFTTTVSFLVLSFVLLLVGCSSLTEQTVQRTVSNDNRFWAEVTVNRGSALKRDWYAAAVGKVHPTWGEIVLRRAGTEICTLQGPGKLTTSWTSPEHLLVTCTGCRQQDVYFQIRKWNVVSISYAFPDSAHN